MNTEEKNKIANSAYLKALDDVEEMIQRLHKEDMYDKHIQAYNDCMRELKKLR